MNIFVFIYQQSHKVLLIYFLKKKGPTFQPQVSWWLVAQIPWYGSRRRGCVSRGRRPLGAAGTGPPFQPEHRPGFLGGPGRGTTTPSWASVSSLSSERVRPSASHGPGIPVTLASPWSVPSPLGVGGLHIARQGLPRGPCTPVCRGRLCGKLLGEVLVRCRPHGHLGVGAARSAPGRKAQAGPLQKPRARKLLLGTEGGEMRSGSGVGCVLGGWWSGPEPEWEEGKERRRRQQGGGWGGPRSGPGRLSGVMFWN